MPLHQRAFGSRQLPFLEQHAIGDADLADVVQERAAVQRIEIAAIEVQLRAERRRVGRQPLAVPFRVGIARLDDASEREEQRFGRLEVVGQALDANQRAHARVQLLGVDRLVEEIVGAGADGVDARRALLHAAHEHDGREARVGRPFHRRADVDAGDLRHHDVEQHEIRTLAVDRFERLVSVHRGDDGVACALEQPPHRRQVRLVVIDHEDASAGPHADAKLQAGDRQR